MQSCELERRRHGRRKFGRRRRSLLGCPGPDSSSLTERRAACRGRVGSVLSAVAYKPAEEVGGGGFLRGVSFWPRFSGEVPGRGRARERPRPPPWLRRLHVHRWSLCHVPSRCETSSGAAIRRRAFRRSVFLLPLPPDLVRFCNSSAGMASHRACGR